MTLTSKEPPFVKGILSEADRNLKEHINATWGRLTGGTGLYKPDLPVVYDVVGERIIGTDIVNRKSIPDVVPTGESLIEIPLIAGGFLKLGYMQAKEGGKIKNITICQINYPNSRGEEYTSPLFSFKGYEGQEGILAPLGPEEFKTLRWVLANFDPHHDIDLSQIDWHDDQEMQVISAFDIKPTEFVYSEAVAARQSPEIQAIMTSESPEALVSVFDEKELEEVFGEDPQIKLLKLLTTTGPLGAPSASDSFAFTRMFYKMIEGEELDDAVKKFGFTFDDLDPNIKSKVNRWLEFGIKHDLYRQVESYRGKEYMGNPYINNKMKSFVN